MKANTFHIGRLVSAVMAGLAVGALGLAGSLTAAASQAAAPEPIVVSAVGNVIQANGPVIRPAAIYYYGYYSTQSKCLAKKNEYMQTGNYRNGGCWKSNEGQWKGWWRLWMDDWSSPCYDRIAPANITALPGSPWSEVIAAA
ncbi:hypothetical protein MMX123_00654 [Microbacterium sp. MM2322]